MTFIVSAALLCITTLTIVSQIQFSASAKTGTSENDLVGFVEPNLPNEIKILARRESKNILNTGIYHQALTSHKRFTVRGFNLYLVETFKKTNILAISKEDGLVKKSNRGSKRKKLKPNSDKTNKSKLKRKFKRPSQKIKRPENFINNQEIYTYSSVNENTTMVLSSDQFVFRPPIPINETNFPLDNVDKPELYASETPVDNILSYSFTDPAIKNYIKFPSVSKIIEETISDKTRQVLANWRQKMIADLGDDGFYNHSEALKTRGSEFHMAVRNAVLGKTTDNCSEVTQNSLKSLSWMLEHITNPMAVESTIAHPKLGYRGVADCIATFRNIPVIIDWKLSDKPKRDLKDTYDAPVQITAYIGALNHDPNYKWGVNHGLVAVAYANGDPCDVFLLAPKHCSIYWRHWLMRFDKFKARSHLHLDHNIDEKSLELI